MEVLIFAIIVGYAIKKMAENGHLDWQGSKAKNRQASRGRSVPKRAASAVQHDVGYWAHQILNGFPKARHGFADGWHAGRTAQAEGQARRQKAKADHLEQRAGLIPELREQRRRQDEALEQIRAARPGSHFPVLLTGRSRSGKPVNPITGEPHDTIAVWDQDDLDRRLAAAAEDPDMEVTTRPMPDLKADDPTYRPPVSEGTPQSTSPGEVTRSSQTPADPSSPAGRLAPHSQGSPELPYRYQDGDLEFSSDKPLTVQQVKDVAQAIRDKQARQTASTEGNTMASDVTYDAVLRHATMAQEFEEAALAERNGRATTAAEIADQMQALGVDSATLGAMADYLEAMDEAQKAQQRAMEAVRAVAENLRRGHAGLAEAHREAPVRAADREFYEEG